MEDIITLLVSVVGAILFVAVFFYSIFLQRSSAKRGARFQQQAMEVQQRSMEMQEEGNQLLREILETLKQTDRSAS
jgi:hypothetical protein